MGLKAEIKNGEVRLLTQRDVFRAQKEKIKNERLIESKVADRAKLQADIDNKVWENSKARTQAQEKIVKNEEEGKSLGLERYQDFYKQSSKLPTEKHTIPQIDGACGFSSVETILKHLGFKISCIDYDSGVYLVNKGL